MTEAINKSTLWNEGSKAALAVGAVPVIYALITQLLSKLPQSGPLMAAVIATTGAFLWAAKFFGCILLMRFFMKRLALKYPSANNKTTLQYGSIISLLSALIVSAYTLARSLTLSAEEINGMINRFFGNNLAMLDLNTRNALDRVMESLPIYSFFTTFIYCFLFGYILSIILSRNIPSQNPFEERSGGDTL